MKKLNSSTLFVVTAIAGSALALTAMALKQQPGVGFARDGVHRLLVDHQYGIRILSDRPVRDLDEPYLFVVESSPPQDLAGFAAEGTLVEPGVITGAWVVIDGVETFRFSNPSEGRWEWYYPGDGFFVWGPEYRIQVDCRTTNGTRTLTTGFPFPG